MMSGSFFVVLQREFLQRIRSVAFWISTIILPLFMGGMIIIPVIISEKQKSSFEVAMVDESGAIQSLLERELEKSRHDIHIFTPDTRDREELKTAVLAKEFDGYMIVPEDVLKTGLINYYGRNVANAVGLSRIEHMVNRSVIAARMQERGINPEEAGKLTSRVNFETFRLSKEGAKKDRGASFFLSIVLFLTLYMVIILYGSFILRSVLEEKTTRVVEVLVSTIRPFPLMMGKIMGVAAVGLTQYLIWVLLGVVAFVAVLPGMNLPEGPGVPQITVGQAVFFFVFFVLGYLMYSTLYAGVGAMFNSEQEAQQMATIVIIPLIVPVLLMQVVLQAPNGTLSTVLSLIPLFTPLLMYLRILVEMPPAWQVALSIALSTMTVILFTYIAGKIYRVGMLMTGKKPTFKDLYRWIRA